MKKTHKNISNEEFTISKGVASFFSFKGRTGRMDYFLGYLLLYCIFVISIMLLYTQVELNVNNEDILILLGVILYVITTIVITIPLNVRRLHDIGISGWWMLLELIPLIGSIAGLVFLLYPGDKEDNKYGKSLY